VQPSQPDRYHRQTLLPQIGRAGQARLGASRALLVGCGALGTVIAEQLVRAGVGSLRIVDRDVVELSNLQRQTLFDESDAAEGVPKAVAAGRRLARVNSEVRVDAVVADFHAGNAQELAGIPAGANAPAGISGAVDLLLDGTDNVETRYLLNDLSVKHGIPWVYGACVGTEGRAMTIRPAAATPCLRCLFEEPPGPGELPTCDTAGVLGPLAGAVASMQAVAALKLLSGNAEAVAPQMLVFDVWANRIRAMDTTGARRPDCPTCGRRRFEFLDGAARRSVSLCGRNAVQVLPERRGAVELASLAARLAGVGRVTRTPHLLRVDLPGDDPLRLTVFADGRLIVNGTTDRDRARSLYARYVGT
jgi:adenylyltransferase/sulfurtransferase